MQSVYLESFTARLLLLMMVVMMMMMSYNDVVKPAG